MKREAEERRLRHLHELSMLNTPHDDLLNGFAEKALALLPGTSIAAVSLVDEERQWFKAVVGMEETEIPRSISFCSHTIETSGVMVVEDATRDCRFARNPLVTSAPWIRFYVGIKLTRAVGALCVIGVQPRRVADAEIDSLISLAQFVDMRLLMLGARSRFSRKLPHYRPTVGFRQADRWTGGLVGGMLL